MGRVGLEVEMGMKLSRAKNDPIYCRGARITGCSVCLLSVRYQWKE